MAHPDSHLSTAPSCNVVVNDPAILDRALTAGSMNWEQVRGEWILLCVPSLVPTYVERSRRLAQAFGHPFKPEEIPQLTELFRAKVQAGYDASPYSRLVVRYGSARPPEKGLLWQLETIVVSPQEQAKKFVSACPPEQFEAFPDAMVLEAAKSLGTAPLKILDIGGGTGRNALPLVDQGHQVTVLDSNGVMLEALDQRFAHQSPPNGIKIIEGSILDDRILLPEGEFDWVILTGVIPYFSSLSELEQVLQRVAIALKPGGEVLFDAFITTEGYEPTPLAKEMGRVSDAVMFPPAVLATASQGAGLTLIAEKDAWRYEMANLNPDAQAARQWLETWASGKRIFTLPAGQRPPVVLKWLRYQKAP